MNPDPRQYFGVGSAVLVVPIVQFFKVTFPNLPSQYWPAVTLLVAIGLNLFIGYFFTNSTLAMSGFLGLLTGLAASGLYSWATAVVPTLASEWSAKANAPPTVPHG